jgi:2-amino-4-hydroxy-6-hydroxymethyldihydropteridine diphosphokinase
VTRAYLALGSNLGDRLARLQAAVDALASEPGVTVCAVSRVYETAPVGGPEQGPYLNAVIAVDTSLAPRELLAAAQRAEDAAGRERGERWAARTLDVDVLLIGDVEIDEPELAVPHPRMWDRGFVLAPLADVAPELVVRPDHGWEGVSRTALALTLPGRHPVGDAPDRPGEPRRA